LNTPNKNLECYPLWSNTRLPLNSSTDIKISEAIAASTFRKKYKYLRKISDFLKMLILNWVGIWVK